MGTKRVGLARVEALIENLKRELVLGAGSSLAGAMRKIKAVSSATTLTEADSGCIVDISGADYVIKLPQDPTAGCTFTFVNTAALGAGGSVNIDAKDGEEFFKGPIMDLENADGSAQLANGTSHDQVKFAASAGAKDTVITCTFIGGNTWLIHDSYAIDESDVSLGTASTNA